VKYSGFPSTARVFVPDAVAGSDAMVPTAGGDLGSPQAVGQYVTGSGTLVLVRVSGADATGAGGFRVGPPQGAAPVVLNSVSEVTLSAGSGFVVYEVADSNPGVQESAQFPTFISMPRVTAAAVASETVTFAPVSAQATASATAPILHFAGIAPPSDCSAVGDCSAKYFPHLRVDFFPITMGAIALGGKMTTEPGYFEVHNDGGGQLDWSLSFTYQDGSGWLLADNTQGPGNRNVRLIADTKNLAPGIYHASVTINAGAAGTQTLPITLTVTAPPPTPTPPPPPPPTATPTVAVSQVLNAATFTTTPLVPGSLGTVMGSHFSGKNVSVTFDGAPATLLYTGDTQINLQVPLSPPTKTAASLVVTVDGISSTPIMVTLAPAWPAVFAHGILNQDGSENTQAATAAAGDILQIFATGIPKGAFVSAQIDAQDLVPIYAGDAPTVPGVQQVNVAVPKGTSAAALLILCATPPGGQRYCSSGDQVAVR
jgi:uncharacterized protein (TIGR03437 family)